LSGFKEDPNSVMSEPVSARLPGTPPLFSRRIFSMVYEAVLLFALGFIADYLFDTLTQSRSGLAHIAARRVWLFAVFGVYFVYFWTHGGQTLPMKTWRIKLEWNDHRPVPFPVAVVRYFACWFFVLLATALAHGLNLDAPVEAAALVAALILPPFAMLIDPDRQFLHDRLLGTRLVNASQPAEPAEHA
jgi:uncharacterized RDD family membrane protein YckC